MTGVQTCALPILHLPDPFLAAITPVQRRVLKPLARCAPVPRVAIYAGPAGKADLAEETLADLVHGDEIFEAGVADIDPGGTAETERRVSGHHGGIGIPRAQACGDVERGAIGEVLDRKSTRLNSSHKPISYAVFCLKKKTKK